MKIRKSILKQTKSELQKSLEYFVQEHNKLIDIIYDLKHELNNLRRR
jgi:hypothetical protein